MKNRVLLFIIGLIIGFASGYLLLGKGNHEVDFTDKSFLERLKGFYRRESFGLTQDSVSHRISPALARVLISKYRSQNRKAIFPLRTIYDSLLHGYYIDRRPLDTILMDKSFTGVSFYIAKDSAANAAGKTNRTFTLVYMGAKYVKQTNTYINIDANGNTATPYDFIQPCPPYCGTFLETAAKDRKMKP